MLPAGQTIAGCTERVCKEFGWNECTMLDLETGDAIDKDEHLHKVLDDFEALKESRRSDALEATLESIRIRLLSTRSQLHFDACHALWELACRPENHDQMGKKIFDAVSDVALRSADPRVSATAAAAVWVLAEVDRTRTRLPAGQLVPARTQ